MKYAIRSFIDIIRTKAVDKYDKVSWLGNKV